MPTLLLDTTLTGLTLGIAQGNKVLAEFMTDEPRSGAVLHPHLQTVLAAQNLKLADIQEVILTVGPGSFTGIRLGLAFAQALKLANPNLTITPIGTLQAAATHYAPQAKTSLTVWLDAAGGQVYQQTFGPDATPMSAAQCLPQPDAEATLAPTTTLVADENLLTDAEIAATLATLPAQALLSTAQNPAHHRPPEPFYLKPLTYRTSA